MTIYKVEADYYKNGTYHSKATDVWQICATEEAARKSAKVCQRVLKQFASADLYVKPTIYVMSDNSDGIFHATKTNQI